MKKQYFNIINKAMMGNDCDVSDDVLIEFCKTLSFHGYPSKPNLKNRNDGVIVKEVPPLVWNKALGDACKRIASSPKINHIYPDR